MKTLKFLLFLSFFLTLLSQSNGQTGDAIVNNPNLNIKDSTILSLCVDKNDIVWFCNNSETFSFNEGTNSMKTEFHGATRLCVDTAGKRYIYNENKYNERVNDDFFGTPGIYVNSTSMDNLGTIWVATNKGIFRYIGKTWINLNTLNSPLKTNIIRGLFLDRKGNMWITTDEDLYICKVQGCSDCSNLWTKYNNTLVGISPAIITSIAFDSKNVAWMNTFGEGIYKMEDNVFSKVNTIGGIYGFITSPIIVDKQDNIWVGTWGNGIVKYKDGISEVYNSKNSSVPSNIINKLACNSSGKIYAGSADKGIFSLEDKPNNNESLSIKPKPLFNIFPNPASQKLYIQFMNGINIDANYSVFDITGKLVTHSNNMNFKENERKGIDISYLSSGEYIIDISYNDKVEAKHFSIQK